MPLPRGVERPTFEDIFVVVVVVDGVGGCGCSDMMCWFELGGGNGFRERGCEIALWVLFRSDS